MESILTSIKKLIGADAEYTPFDPDIIMHINTVFKDLRRLGVGPAKGFIIEDDTSVWTDYIADPIECADVKTYMYLRVKLLFDPPTNASHLESIKEQITKFEWTINADAESEETEV